MEEKSELTAVPVGPQSSGKGLPYAPENWPKKGDIWTWRVGARVSKSGFFQDRYLFPPERFNKLLRADRPGLVSKVAAQEFIRKEFPNVNVDSFFSSFLWKIPSNGVSITEKRSLDRNPKSNSKVKTETQIPKSDPIPYGHCKARNKTCHQIQESKSLQIQDSNSLKFQESNSLKNQDSKSPQIEESNSLQIQESNCLKNQESNSLQIQESNSLKNQDSKSTQIQESNSLKIQESNSLKNQDSNSLKIQEFNSLKIQDSKSPKIQESNSLKIQESNSHSFPPCDICCEEPGFCLHCCCILCGNSTDLVHALNAHTYFKCTVCGHGAHIKCAHRCFMAGVVGGSIGLDGEYYCRRCDSKADLVPHFEGVFRVLKGSEKEEDVERVLGLGFRVLAGVKREMGRNLYERIDSALVKIKCGIPLGEILKEDMALASNNTSGDINNTTNGQNQNHFLEAQSTMKPCKRKVEFDNNEDINIITKKQEICNNGHESDFLAHNKFDRKNLTKKLENEIQQALENLKKLHEQQFKIVEQNLLEQKDNMLKLYMILELERSDLADPIVKQCNDGETYKNLVKQIIARLDEVKIAEGKLQILLKNCDLIVQKSKDVVKECFGAESNGLLC